MKTTYFLSLALAAVVIVVSACAPKPLTQNNPSPDAAKQDAAVAQRDAAMSQRDAAMSKQSRAAMMASRMAPTPDPRVGLGGGLFDAEEAMWNLKVVSTTRPPAAFVGVTNSDLAFTGNYAIQGNYNGVMIWDISNPAKPVLVKDYICPASQSDVSVYGNLMFVSGEGLSGRLDCGSQGVSETVSAERLRGIRIFDITDIRNPSYVANVQTCRGSHTHSVLKDPKDDENVYVYISGSSSVRPAEEVPGCVSAGPSDDPNSSLFKIEVIKVPLAHPELSAVVNAPKIFEGLVAPPQHGDSPADAAELEEARARGEFVAEFRGRTRVLSSRMIGPLLDEFLKQRGGSETATAADSAAFREALPALMAERFPPRQRPEADGPRPGPTQCHDITLYPEIGLAGGACGGYGLLLDISDPANPKRIDAVADSNFSYWHSATFSNDGSKVLFTDEWGGGGQPKCRATDPKEWGANALFAIENGKMKFKSYYKLPAPQTSQENCVAHNGSLIPIPGREVMVQAWYQGGISIFDWTDLSNPIEIAYHDRGPVDTERMASGGSWSVYWYNGVVVSSEIARGLDIFALEPSGYISANELAAAKTVKLKYLNAQGQPKFVWPATFSLAQAYVDQLERSDGLPASQIESTRLALTKASATADSARRTMLTGLASELDSAARTSGDPAKVRVLATAVRDIAAANP